MKMAALKILLLGVFLLALAALPAKVTNVLEEINITPNPMDNYTVITLTFNNPANIGVNVETDTGQVIKTIYWGTADEYIQLSWDRYDDTGNYTPSGKYYLVVNHQGRYTSTKKTLILK